MKIAFELRIEPSISEVDKAAAEERSDQQRVGYLYRLLEIARPTIEEFFAGFRKGFDTPPAE